MRSNTTPIGEYPVSRGDEDPDRVREAYGDSVYDRLVDVKAKYDADNVFRHNQNIR